MTEAGAPISEADLLDRFLGMTTASILTLVAAEHGSRFWIVVLVLIVLAIAANAKDIMRYYEIRNT